MNGLKRIQKEYKDLIHNPIENIKILPNPDNIYEWHYLINSNNSPYNGEYYGILTLDKEYPMKAPSIIMKTPSGRFEVNKKLCFSMSDYHQETWNPSWNIRTIIIGFYSFMLEESETLGSINDSYENRVKFANESYDYNKNIILESVFNENTENTENKNTENTEIKKSKTNILNTIKICKFCYESEGELFEVCNCKGTNGYIHKECLHNWQLKTILNQSTHPDQQVNSDTICNVCNSEYKIKYKTRNEIMSELTGEEIIQQIKLGYVFISSIESSLKNIDLTKKYKSLYFYENIMNWTYGVFIIVEKNEGILALNTNRPISQSYSIEHYYNIYKNYIEINQIQQIDILEETTINDKIFIGGPCENKILFALIYLKNLDEFNVTFKNVKLVQKSDNEYLIFGEYKYIYKLYLIKPEYVIKLHLYLGYAGWSNTQLISEFAKTNWGITNTNMNILFEKNNYKLIKQENCLFVNKNIYSNNS